MKEKRIYATSFRMSEDVRDYICSLGKDDSFADNVEKWCICCGTESLIIKEIRKFGARNY